MEQHDVAFVEQFERDVVSLCRASAMVELSADHQRLAAITERLRRQRRSGLLQDVEARGSAALQVYMSDGWGL